MRVRTLRAFFFTISIDLSRLIARFHYLLIIADPLTVTINQLVMRMNVGKPHSPKNSTRESRSRRIVQYTNKRNIHQVFIEFGKRGGKRAKGMGKEDSYDEDYCFLNHVRTEEHGEVRKQHQGKIIEMNRVGLRRFPAKYDTGAAVHIRQLAANIYIYIENYVENVG